MENIVIIVYRRNLSFASEYQWSLNTKAVDSLTRGDWGSIKTWRKSFNFYYVILRVALTEGTVSNVSGTID